MLDKLVVVKLIITLSLVHYHHYNVASQYYNHHYHYHYKWYKYHFKAMLDKLVVVKLNGALATALGCRYLHLHVTLIFHFYFIIISHLFQRTHLHHPREKRSDHPGPDCAADRAPEQVLGLRFLFLDQCLDQST